MCCVFSELCLVSCVLCVVVLLCCMVVICCTSPLAINTENEMFKDHCWIYLVTALVPSETACLASSPGKISLTAD